MSLGRNSYEGVPKYIYNAKTQAGSVTTTLSGSIVEVEALPPVTIGSSVEVSSLPNVVVDSGNIEITSLPSVTVGSMPSVSVSSMPVVTIVSGTLNQGTPTSPTSASAWPVRLFSGNNNKSIIIDTFTDSLVTTEYEHHAIHIGQAFSAYDRVDVTGAGTNRDYLFMTPTSTSWIHFRPTFRTEAEFDISIQENPTVSNNGTLLPSFNRDRNSLSTSGLTLYHTPTVTVSGTTIKMERTGSGSSVGGGSESYHEWILKQNTKYLMRFSKVGAGTHYISLKLWWYELVNL